MDRPHHPDDAGDASCRVLLIKTIKNAGHVYVINRDEYVFIFNGGSWASF